MGLPWLESLHGAAPEGPQRFAVLFMGTGISPGRWWAKGSGAAMELGESLAPLEPVKSRLNVIDGLFNKEGTGQGIHPAMTGNLLSGVPIRKGSIIHGGITIDQMLANRIGQDTQQPSMVLACERAMTGFHESNFSNAYSSHISWQSADSPVPNEMYPSLAFDSLFENGGQLRNTSVLDRVKEHAASLRGRINATDRNKLDEYLASVREVERSMERLRTEKARAEERASRAGRPLSAMPRPADGLPEDIRDHIRLMSDIIALGFQTDRTRVASLLLARDLSAIYYPFLGVSRQHHGASHYDTEADYQKIVRFHVEQLLYLAQRLDAMKEGERSVLDNSCLLFLSNMWSGTKHDNKKVPVLTLGGLGGKLATGRALDYFTAGDDNRKLCSLYLGIMDRMGVVLPQFGDAKARLAGF
ncbi:MAG: DUF1552 domain-containing protein [Acidobacteria bacterium]|jgi:hypothetical protein|nr:DUF1552 domain-containing protein [Bryobacteraceae bacterium CoA2 C42]MCA2964537.1 DUF1552 domain-containing protein [Acidobacteriaceae bacterium]